MHSEYFRFGSGIALEIGKKDIQDYGQNGEDYYDVITRENFQILYANISFSYIFKKRLYSTLELSLPMVSNTPYNYHIQPNIFKTEFSINF